MNSRKQPSRKVLDVSRPKKRTADTPSAPELVIPKRSIIVPVSEAEEPASEPIKARHAAEDIQPATDQAKTKPESEQAAAPEQPEAPAKPETPSDETAADTPEQSPESEEPEDTDTTPKADHPVHKALADAKREQELQGYIENRDFFVPIGAVARKRSLKVSIMLVFVEFLLGLLLINLMLDAGLIRLLEKIPHTNFFGL